MVQESIKTALKNFGLTEKELEVYLLLARRGAQKTGQIAKQLKMNKGLSYRLLKNLQKKGVVETTLESPTRYTALAFEKVIDSYVKSKRKEAERIEEAKDSLLSDWNKISQEEIDSSLEKFGVIEGKKKIFKKISQIMKETEKQIRIGFLVPDLIDAERFGTFEITNHLINSGKNLRILTKLSKENLQSLKILRKTIKSNLTLRGTNPSLELSSFSRIVIRDDDEIALFISGNQPKLSGNQTDVCLFTNCKSIIQAFTIFFEDLWRDSIEIAEGIAQLETGKAIPEMHLMKDPLKSKQKFQEALNEAENNILVISSSEGLSIFERMLIDFRNHQERKISIRIMVPIVENNLESAQNLLKFCKIRHIASSYNETVIVDSKQLFQFKHPKLNSHADLLPFFNNTLYTNDVDFIDKTKNMLNDLWLKATVPSNFKIKSIFVPTNNPFEKGDSTFTALKNFRRVVTFNIEKEEGPKKLTEKDVLNKILRAKTGSDFLQNKDAAKFYASTGQAIIRPPKEFNLPDMMLHAFHVDNQSTNGEGDSLVVFLWLETQSGFGFVPVALLGNNSSQKLLKKVFEGTPAGDNFHMLSKDKFSVRVHGNTLFAVWTEEIPLVPPKYILPPSCFSLEGFGEIKTGSLSVVYRSGFKSWMEFNALEALVTFFHPSSKYSGPGTDGILFRDYIGEHFIPK